MTSAPTYNRLQPDERRAAILQAAIRLAESDGWLALSRDAVATAAGVSPGLVSWYFLATSLLRDEVMQHAVDTGILSVVAEGILARHAVALAASVSLRAAAFEHMVGGGE